MNIEEILDQSENAKNILTCVAILVGGFWTYWKFIRNGDGRAKVTFELGLRVVDHIKSSYIVELICEIENKGMVRHKIVANSFVYDLRFLKNTDALVNGFVKENTELKMELKYYQLYFPEEFKIFEKSTICWVPENWLYTYIEPGTRQKYSTIVAIPADVSVVLFHSKFAYENSPKDFHTADAVFKLG